MTIGGSIALIVIGAILAFAVELDIAGLDIDVIGYILIVGGIVGLIAGLMLLNRRDRVVTTTAVGTPVREREVVRDRDIV